MLLALTLSHECEKKINETVIGSAVEFLFC